MSKFVEKFILCGYYKKKNGKNLIYIQCNSKILRAVRGIMMLTDFMTGHNPIISFFQDTVVCLP